MEYYQAVQNRTAQTVAVVKCYDPPYSSLFVPSYSGVRQRESPTL